MTESVSQSPPTALPSPPFIPIPGLPNFRDIGGYAISSLPSTHSIRRNLIFRAAAPETSSPEATSIINTLGITHFYDLRSVTEIQKNIIASRAGIVHFDGTERVFAPVFVEQDYSPESIAIRFRNYAGEGTEGFTHAYADILTHAPPSYALILSHLASSSPTPLVLHCTAGKDRTGVLCALLLSLCGVSDAVVAHEYALTEAGLLAHWDKEKVIAHLLRNPVVTFGREGAERMLGARAENMQATLVMIREKFGGPEGYMREHCGLSAEDVQQIRENLVVEEPPVHPHL